MHKILSPHPHILLVSGADADEDADVYSSAKADADTDADVIFIRTADADADVKNNADDPRMRIFDTSLVYSRCTVAGGDVTPSRTPT